MLTHTSIDDPCLQGCLSWCIIMIYLHIRLGIERLLINYSIHISVPRQSNCLYYTHYRIIKKFNVKLHRYSRIHKMQLQHNTSLKYSLEPRILLHPADHQDSFLVAVPSSANAQWVGHGRPTVYSLLSRFPWIWVRHRSRGSGW